MDVSVVVPTLNEELYIGRCLESIRRQTIDCEIIVVDSLSEDKTVEVANEFADRILIGKCQIPFNRQLGLDEASGNIVVSTDADCIHPRNWLESLTTYFSREDVVAVSGPTIPIPEESIFMDDFCYFIGNSFLWLAHKNGLVWFRGSNSAYRRDVALKAGGYNLDLVAREDSNLSQRVSQYGVTIFDWNVRVMTSMRRRRETGWLRTLKYYIDTPVSILRGKAYYEKV
jgi:glycosyltransferase involved in cell wall biosynthesis